MKFTNLERKLIEANLDSMKNEYKTGEALEDALGCGTSIDLSHGRRFDLVAILLNGEFSDYLADFIFDAFEHDINLGAVVDMIEVILDDNSFSLPDVEEMKKLTHEVNEFENKRTELLRGLYESLTNIAQKLNDDVHIAVLNGALDAVLKSIGDVGVGIFPTIQRQVAIDPHIAPRHIKDFVEYLEAYGEWVHVDVPLGYERDVNNRIHDLESIALGGCGVNLTQVIKTIKNLKHHTVDARAEHPRNIQWL
ncbi:hypothetical protein [Bacillus safensis]|uniref:Uncharacterized protein n=1 Tax=Bacillus safensis TaxID=561879 RepID=A0A1L6ZGY0_BACIA|nr:hypothetical protein [Bacillus safensis]APT45791.1 hypothetical protein BSA145_07690 [Bacillus safensis]